MSEQTGVIQAYLKALRWFRFDIEIKNVCWNLGLECEITRETSFLKEFVRFKIEGEVSKLIIFKKWIELITT